MFKHILIPTDGSPLSGRAALGGVQLARSLSARVTAITASVPFHLFALDRAKASVTESIYRENCEKRAAGCLDVVRRAAESAGVEFAAMHVFDEDPHTAILDAAEQKDCDAICMASHGRKGLAAVFLGSQAIQVLTNSSIPVVVWR